MGSAPKNFMMPKVPSSRFTFKDWKVPKVPSTRSDCCVDKEESPPPPSPPGLFDTQLIHTKQLGVVTIPKVLIDRLLWYEDGFKNSFFVDTSKLGKFVEYIIDESSWREVLGENDVPETLRCPGLTHVKFIKTFQGRDGLTIRTRIAELGAKFVGDVSEGSNASFLVSIIVSTEEKTKRKLVAKLFAQSQFAICASRAEIEGEEKGKGKNLIFSMQTNTRKNLAFQSTGPGQSCSEC